MQAAKDATSFTIIHTHFGPGVLSNQLGQVVFSGLVGL